MGEAATCAMEKLGKRIASMSKSARVGRVPGKWIPKLWRISRGAVTDKKASTGLSLSRDHAAT